MHQLIARENRRQGARGPSRGPGLGSRARDGAESRERQTSQTVEVSWQTGPLNLKLRDCVWNTTEGGLSGGMKGGHSVRLGLTQGGIYKLRQTHLNTVTADL